MSDSTIPEPKAQHWVTINNDAFFLGSDGHFYKVTSKLKDGSPEIIDLSVSVTGS